MAIVFGIPFWGLLSLFLSVPLGFFPGAAAAVVYWLVLRRYTKANPRPIARVLLGGCIGAVISSAFGGLLFPTGSSPGSYPFEVNLIAWLVAGIVGGAAGALASGKETYRALESYVQHVV